MQTPRPINLRTLLMTLDSAVLAITWLGLCWARSHLLEVIPGATLGGVPLQIVSFPEHAALVVLIVPVWLMALSRHQTYDAQRKMRAVLLFRRLLKAAILGTLVFLGVCFLTKVTDILSRTMVLGFALAAMLTLFAGRRLAHTLIGRWAPGLDRWNLLLIGDEGSELLQILDGHDDWGIDVIGVLNPTPSAVLPVLGSVDQLSQVLAEHPVDQVLLTGRDWSVETLRTIADACAEVGVRFSLNANFLDASQGQAAVTSLDGWTMLHFSTGPTDVGALVAKRAIDMLIGGLLLLVLAPVFFLTGLGIKLGDGGPVLFRQERIGLNGRRFTMLKFRSMVVNAQAMRSEMSHLNEVEGPVFKVAADPRITPVGRVIRRMSIDELPQLWNVLRGDMSLVGPRPPLFEEVLNYKRWQMRRLSMKPGLTCTWQVSGRSNVDFDTWMALDLEYIDNWSLFLDAKLLVQTVPVVLMGQGAR